MGTEFFLGSLPFIGGIGFVAFIALGVAALGESKHGGSMGIAVRRLYIYLVSFLTLLLISTAVISLLDLGLRSVVFTKADPVGSYQTPPPTPYIPTKDASAEVVAIGGEKLTCADETCSLTDDQKTAIEQWTNEYKTWKEQNKPSQQRANLLVTALSFLIIAGIAFGIHWFFAVRDAKGSVDSPTRATYLWAMSFVWLIASVVTMGFLLTTALKAGFNVETTTSYREPASLVVSNTETVASFETCGTICGLSEETITLANEWKSDYDTWNARNTSDDKTRTRQNSLATQLSLVLVALPLFAYHFMKAWRENRKPQEPPQAKMA